MAYLNTTPSQTSCTMSVGGLNSTSVYTEIYISCNGSNSTNLTRSTTASGYTTSNSWTIYSLSAGTQYWASYRLLTRAGSTATDGAYFTTTSPPSVGGVGTVYVSNNGAGSISVSWSSATNATDYNVEVYHYSTGSFVTSKLSTSTSTTISGLNQGVYYQVKVYGRRSGSPNGTPSYGYITTLDYSVGGVGTVTVTGGSTVGSLQASWSSATNATGYTAEVYDASGNYTGKYASGSSTSATFTGLSENTYYGVKVFGTRSGQSNGTPSWGYGYTRSFAPGALSGLTASGTSTRGQLSVSWSSATNAQGYRWEVYRGNTTASSALVSNGDTTSTSVTISSLLEYTYYTVKVYAYRSGYTNGTAQTVYVRTKDVTAPVISSITGDGNGKVYFTWTASDAHSGLRSTNTYYTQISNANGTTYGQGSYTTNNYKTFTVGGDGSALVFDAYYYLYVVAYDAEGNSSSSNVRVQYKRGRPTSWDWHTTKTAGAVVSLTASEWNSFCTRINQFRAYKGLANYSFTTVASGNTITATIVNQARTAINAMSPPTSVPTSAVQGGIMTASFFNGLRSSLNSIQ